MRFSRIVGTMERRVLVNFQVDVGVAREHVPEPFSPVEVEGRCLAGISLMRLRALRPGFAPAALGVSSEHATHWIGVTWEEDDALRTGIYIPRRDTDSRIHTLVGSWLFPGVQHHAQFRVRESEEYLQITVDSADREVHISIAGGISRMLPPTSLFHSTDDVVAFLQRGSAGYAQDASSTMLEGVEMRCRDWTMRPLDVEHVSVTWFEDRSLFPEGSVRFDSALLLRQVEHEWVTCPPLAAPTSVLQTA